MSEVSTKPYLIRAIFEWCTDCGYTPYIAVAVDERTQVPREFVKNGEIVLNISTTATNRLDLGNEWIDFQARFGGRARDLSIPVYNVTAIYARETGHGMAFDVPKALALTADNTGVAQAETDEDDALQGAADASDKPVKAAKSSAKGKGAVRSAEAAKADAGEKGKRFPADQGVTDGDDPEGGGKGLKPDTGAPSKRSKTHLTRVK